MNDDCQRVDAVADDLALGLLTGEQRATALAHLEDCHACRTELVALTEVADAVLLLAPATAPDPDFERRVLSRVSSGVSHDPATERPSPVNITRLRPRRPRNLRWAFAAAAVVAALVGLSFVSAARRDPGAVTADMVDGRGNLVGRVELVADHGTAVQMDLPGWADLLRQYGDAPGRPYWLEVELEDGSRVWAALPAAGPGGTWSVTTPVDPSRIVSVAITDPDRHPWCRARFV